MVATAKLDMTKERMQLYNRLIDTAVTASSAAYLGRIEDERLLVEVIRIYLAKIEKAVCDDSNR